MNLDEVADEIRAALDTIVGLRVPDWGVESVTAPAALVGLPERIEYDQTYQRGTDRYPDLPVIVLVGKPTSRAARKQMAEYADGSGPKSVKQAVESYPFTTCHPGSVTVSSCEFDEVKFAGIPYMAATFHIDLTGNGA